MAGSEAPRAASRTQLLMAAGAMAGIQICYSAQINYGSSALLALGLDESSVSLAWLAGPLSGLIVQPIVGVASDACTSPLGKRRPFLIAGAGFTTAALLLFSNALYVAQFIIGASHPAVIRVALAIAVFSFFLLDFSIQAIQAPLRALITDIAPGDLLPLGNVYIALFTGMGNLLGSLLSSRKLSIIFPVFSSDTQALFALAAIFLITTVTICVLTVHEIPLEPPEPETGLRRSVGQVTSQTRPDPLAPSTTADEIDAALNADSNVRLLTSRYLPYLNGPSALHSALYRVGSYPSMFMTGLEYSPSMQSLMSISRLQSSRMSRQPSRTQLAARESSSGSQGIGELLMDAPRPFWRVFVVQLFTWFGFFSLFVFVNAWVGTNVFLGRGNAPQGSHLRELFEDGVRLGGVGNALTAFVTVAYSPVLTVLLERYGILRTYAFSQFVEALCLTSAHFIRGTPGQDTPSLFLRIATVLDIGAFGVVWATTMGVPWAIIGKALNDNPVYQPRIGLFTTIFNVSQSFPQLFVSFGSPFILRHFNNDVSAVMFIGGLLALVGLVLVFALRVDIFDEGEDFGDDEEAGGYGASDKREMEQAFEDGSEKASLNGLGDEALRAQQPLLQGSS